MAALRIATGLLLLSRLTFTAAGEDPVTLWRTPVRDSAVCALSGRELVLPEQSPRPGRAWAGLIRTSDETLRCELSRRHRLESEALLPVWRQECHGSDPAHEAELRLQHSRRFEQAFVDVVIIQSAESDQLTWHLDNGFDGVLQYQGPITAPLSTSAHRIPDDCMTLSLVTRNQQGTITAAGPPDVAPASAVTQAAANTRKQPQPPIDRLTATLQTLDHPAVRKQHLMEINTTADQLIRLIERQHGPNSPLLADVLYRKGRALGYRELPDVVAVTPIEDPDALHQEFEATFRRLRSLVDVRQPEYILLAIRRERRRGSRGRALQLLEIYRTTHPSPVWYHKKRFDLLQELQLSTAAHQAAAELWLHGERPAQPVPVIFRCDSQQESLTIDSCWRARPPWRADSLTLTTVAPTVMEAVVWLPVNHTFKIHSEQTDSTEFTTDAAFVQTGAVVHLARRLPDDSSTRADSR